jgi:hypothetical protein
MSYKIVDSGVFPRENPPSPPCRPYSTYIFYILTACHEPANPARMQPAHIRPDQLPDPWLLDSEALLKELARIRELTLHIPAIRNELIGPTNTVIDAIWDLEQRLRYCLHLHCEAQRQFHTRAAAQLSKRQTKPLDRHAVARPANARRKV